MGASRELASPQLLLESLPDSILILYGNRVDSVRITARSTIPAYHFEDYHLSFAMPRATPSSVHRSARFIIPSMHCEYTDVHRKSFTLSK